MRIQACSGAFDAAMGARTLRLKRKVTLPLPAVLASVATPAQADVPGAAHLFVRKSRARVLIPTKKAHLVRSPPKGVGSRELCTRTRTQQTCKYLTRQLCDALTDCAHLEPAAPPRECLFRRDGKQDGSVRDRPDGHPHFQQNRLQKRRFAQ